MLALGFFSCPGQHQDSNIGGAVKEVLYTNSSLPKYEYDYARSDVSVECATGTSDWKRYKVLWHDKLTGQKTQVIFFSLDNTGSKSIHYIKMWFIYPIANALKIFPPWVKQNAPWKMAEKRNQEHLLLECARMEWINQPKCTLQGQFQHHHKTILSRCLENGKWSSYGCKGKEKGLSGKTIKKSIQHLIVFKVKKVQLCFD